MSGRKIPIPPPTGILAHLWGNQGTWHSLSYGKGKDDFHTDGVYERPADLMAAAEKRTATGNSCWFGLHPMDDRPKSARGKAEDISAVAVIGADFDWHDPEAHADADLPGEAELRERLRKVPVQPSVVINTGHGLQVYWPLETPVSPAEGDQLVKAWSAWLLEHHGLDNERDDLASVLRVPGTINYKLTDDPVPVVVEKFDLRRFKTTTFTSRTGDLATTSSGSVGGASAVSARGLDKVLATLRADDRDQDADALEVLCKAHGGHHPYISGKGEVFSTRPGKTAGTSASVGYQTPGVVRMFTPNWKGFDQHGYYVVNDAGDELVPEGDDLYSSTSSSSSSSTAASSSSSTTATAEPPKSWAEAHVAEMLAESLRGRYIWSRKLGWLRWDGRRWKSDENERVLEDIRRWIIQLGRNIMAKATADDMKAVANYTQAGRIASLATLTRRMEGISIEPEQLDADVGLLNARNGIVDLRTGELRGHDPQLYMTKIAVADYIPDARHADVDTALSAIEPGPRDWTQRFLGHAATGEAAEDLVAIWDGGGGNGKTTVLQGARSALGDYARPIARELIMRTTREEHPTAYAELYRVRLAFIEELPEDGVLRVEVLKALSGGGEVRARYMHKDAWTFELSHSLLIATNHRPRVLTLEDAIWRRLRLVPFPHRFAGAGDEQRHGDRDKDLGLRDRVRRGNEQRQAMLSWIVAGAIRWYADGIGHDPEIAATTGEWKMAEDVIGGFLADRMVPAVGQRVSAKDLYLVFREWSVDQGNQAPSQKVFGRRLLDHATVIDHNIEKLRTGTGVVYVGLRLRGELEEMHSWATDPAPPAPAAKPLVDEPDESCEPLGGDHSKDTTRERFTTNGSQGLRLTGRCPDCHQFDDDVFGCICPAEVA